MLFLGSRVLLEQQWSGLPPEWRANSSVQDVPLLACSCTREDLNPVLKAQNVSRVFFLGGHEDYLSYSALAQLCHTLGLDIILPLSADSPLLKSKSPHLRLVHHQGHDFLLFFNSPIHRKDYAIKAVVDRFIALLLLVATSPLWLLAALLIKLGDPKGGVFFKQQRSGLFGKPFAIWKFRTMYMDAEARLSELRQVHGIEEGGVFKLDNDPRIIPLGAFLRKSSIDELPQLLNILSGEMSLIGPRPLPVAETQAFPKIEQRRRLCVLPGLSCYWQIEGRSEHSDLDVMVAKDGKYIDSWSLWRDAHIFMRTIPAVLSGRGAK